MQRRGALLRPEEKAESINETSVCDWKFVAVGTEAGEDHLDWERFHAHATREAISRLFTRSLKLTLVVCPTVAVAHIYTRQWALSCAFGYPAAIVCAIVTIFVYAVFAKLSVEMINMLAHLLEKSQSIWVGCLIQLWVFMAIVLVAPYSVSLVPQEELMKHRMFLTTSLPLLVAAPYCYHMPSLFFATVACPMWISTWLWFHFSVGFLNVACIISAVSLCVGVAYLNHLSIQSRYRHFHTTCTLEEERKVLTATQNALYGMLSSLCDASCTCNGLGTISSSTPQLKQLLGDAQDLVGSSLCAFAENDVEMDRLQLFLRTAASVAEHQALSLQCALRPLGNVSLYVIRLPPTVSRHTFSSELQDRLFIGIKAGAPEATIGESSGHALSNDHAFAYDFLSMHDDTQLTCKPLDTLSVSDSVWSQSVKSGVRSLGTTHLRSVAVQTYTSTTSTQSVQTEPTTMQNVAIHTKTVASEATGRPPRLPTSPDKSRGTFPRRIVLNTKKRALNHFRKTPTATINLIIFDTLLKMNLGGKGCCFYHITLAGMMRACKALAEKKCMPEWIPEHPWQCGRCNAINTEESGSDEEAEHTCVVCQHDQPNTSLLESAESSSADMHSS